MDLTPVPNPNPNPNPDPDYTLAFPSKSKLPIKRKLPEPEPGSTAITPLSKYHRVWTEPDEILFLRGLLESSSTQSLSFPRDLPIFYSQFSETTSNRYTKSQLYEKLRRLRRKFRVTSSRLSRGLELSDLSPHDFSVFELSNKLWGTEYGSGRDCDRGDWEGEAKRGVARSVEKALEEAVREVRRRKEGFERFEKRWRKQREAEIDAFFLRLRLVLDQHC